MRFGGWEDAGDIALVRGERSRLADFAWDTL
jgi:predicted ribonuclease YlaK